MFSLKLLYSSIFLSVLCGGIFFGAFYKNQIHLSEQSYFEPLNGDKVSTTTATATPPSSVLVSNNKLIQEKKIRILVVAGHEPTYGGAEYKTFKERDMTVRISKYLSEYLRMSKKFEVIEVRDDHKWNSLFVEYFTNEATTTKEFYLLHKATMAKQIINGEMKEVFGVPHNPAPEDVALHLYGINRWADAHDIDLVLHIHLNDTPRKDVSLPGVYTGIALYVPERQYKNSSTSMAIGRSIFPYLMKYGATSTLPTEKSGIIEDQELIALGKYNTLKTPSVLIEYGYIYENQFQNSKAVDGVFKTLASQTYAGIHDYFFGPTKTMP